MQAFPKVPLWRSGALAWVAGASLALAGFAAPARSELAFAPERARLVCAGAAPEPLKAQGNALHLPVPTDAQMEACRLEIDYAARDPALAERAAAAGYVELVGLKLVRAAFPERLAVNRAGVALVARPHGALTLSMALETLLGGDRRRGAALTLAFRAGEGEEARTNLSPTLLVERTEPPAPLRAKRPGN